jgi:hypothetical protein
LCVVVDCPLPGKINGPVQYVFFGNLNYHPYAHFLMPSFNDHTQTIYIGQGS